MSDNKPEPPYKNERERALCQRIKQLEQELEAMKVITRSAVFQFRVTYDELDQLKLAADEAGLNTSNYVRSKLGLKTS